MTFRQEMIDTLNAEYKKYILALRRVWLAENRDKSRVLYELMSPDQRAHVHRVTTRWQEYITPIAEAWWAERGYAITWPEGESKSITVHELVWE